MDGALEKAEVEGQKRDISGQNLSVGLMHVDIYIYIQEKPVSCKGD